jgi:ATP-dependent DNA helicase RecG
MTIQPYSDDDLDRMLADLETDSSERKESFRGEAPRTVREAVCAFANDLAGHGRPGVVFIGVRDDGAPAGLVVTDELLRRSLQGASLGTYRTAAGHRFGAG